MIRIGALALPTHNPPIVDRFVKEAQPSFMMTRTEAASPDRLAYWHTLSPATRFQVIDGPYYDSLRDADDTVDHFMHCDLSKRAKDDADSFARLRDKGWGSSFAAFNEPPIWRGRDFRLRLVEYYSHWKPAMHAHGLSTGDLNLSVSWPLVNHLDTENWWPDLAPVFDMQHLSDDPSQGDTTNLHEYMSSGGMHDLGNVPWRMWKHKLCPTPHHNIVISEISVDEAVLPSHPGHAGWRNFWSPERYLLELRLYHSNLDPRVIGTCAFLLDFQSRDWLTFLIDPLVSAGYFSPQHWPAIEPHLHHPQLHLPCDQSCRVTQLYGERPDYYRQFGVAGHTGIDFAPSTDVFNSPIRAAAPGRVYRIREGGGYGLHLYVNHGDCATLYAHAAKVLVHDQQDVTAGQPIAIMGSTGNSTGIHLHFGLLVYGQFSPSMNDWVDPQPYLPLPSASHSVPVTQPDSSPALTARWNAEQADRDLQSAIASLDAIHRRLVDIVIPAAYTLERDAKR